MSNVIVPTNPADQKRIRDFLQEVSNAYCRIQSEKDFIKEAVDAIVEEFELPRKYVSKMARVYHKNSYSKEVTEQEDFTILYEQITGQTAND